ncbi:MAG TPA: hypothetical protein VHL08_02000 [Dongiaceae bacterium]|jgi:hypothetical protein|nr:hypothetical protein [Dongiaceae bacterium]
MIVRKKLLIVAIVALAGALTGGAMAQNCSAQIQDLHGQADALKTSKKKTHVEHLLRQASTAANAKKEKACMNYVVQAQKALGGK